MFTSALHSNVRGATLTARKTPFSLLLHNRRVYRGAAYELPEQIRYIMYVCMYVMCELQEQMI
jgi:hypothetical protein